MLILLKTPQSLSLLGKIWWSTESNTLLTHVLAASQFHFLVIMKARSSHFNCFFNWFFLYSYAEVILGMISQILTTEKLNDAFPSNNVKDFTYNWRNSDWWYPWRPCYISSFVKWYYLAHFQLLRKRFHHETFIDYMLQSLKHSSMFSPII